MKPTRLQRGLRTTALGLSVNGVLAVIKVAAGVLGNSYALIADGIESLADMDLGFPDEFFSEVVYSETRRALDAIGDEDKVIAFPVGRYQKTEQNLRANGRIQLLVASRKVQGSRSPGQGCLISGTGEIVLAGKYVDIVRTRFPWARGALVVKIEDVRTQL
jgi:hypothetical protein